MSLRGIEIHTEESPQAIIKSADGSLSLKTNKGTVEGFSHVMFATGRRPNTKVFKFVLCTLLLSVTAFFRFFKLPL
jgi:pyruvate/2-oxoglutarate dehydrogenase complex dihydrolipoamide dehydrogenase (E3) component